MARPRGPFGPGPQHLLVEGVPVAPLTVADDPASRRRGLLGSTSVIGALWLTKCPSVHMVGMRYPIDVAVLDRHGRVLAVATLQPWWGLTFPRWRASATIEAPAGALAQWGVRPGVALAIGRVEGPSQGGPPWAPGHSSPGPAPS